MTEDSRGLESSLIQVLYNTMDECGEPGWLSFNQLLVSVASSQFTEDHKDDYRKDSSEFIDLAEKLIEQAIADGLVEKFEEGPVLNNQVKISAYGLQEAGFGDESANEEEMKPIDATDWTGLGKNISAKQKAQIRAKANDLLSLIIQSDADEQTRLDACKRVEAVLSLLEAPNSPWKEIVALLSHPVLNAFFATTSLIQLIVGAAS